jgi:hypothetical protein
MQFDELLISSQSTKQVTHVRNIYMRLLYSGAHTMSHSRNDMRLNAMASLIFICIDLQKSHKSWKIVVTNRTANDIIFFNDICHPLHFLRLRRCHYTVCTVLAQYCFLHREGKNHHRAQLRLTLKHFYFTHLFNLGHIYLNILHG